MKWITPGSVDGTMAVPGSKSITQRALLLAALADGPSRLTGANTDADARAAARIATAWGARVTSEADVVHITPGARPRSGSADVGESATALRLGAALSAVSPQPMTLIGCGTLRHRDLQPTVISLRQAGAGAIAAAPGCIHVRGPIRAGVVSLDGTSGSQHLSGLALALAQCDAASRVRVHDMVSTGYVHLTAAVGALFGLRIDIHGDTLAIEPAGCVQAASFAVEPDWSSAAFALVAGASAGRVRVPGLRADSPQPDAALLPILRACGAHVVVDDDGIAVAQPSSGRLKPFDVDVTDTPDLAPPLVALAAAGEGTSRLRGVHRLRGKESDRLAALGATCAALGITWHSDADTAWITPGVPQGGVIDPHADHRIAMAGAVLALRADGPVGIANPGCVGKSDGTFFDRLEALQ